MKTVTSLKALFTLQELQQAIDDVQCGKATGADKVPNEVYKFACPQDVKELLVAQFNEVFMGRAVPAKLKNVTISILFKKGDESDCDNYRGLSLINHEGKLLERMVQNRLLKFVRSNLGEGIIPPSQFGFTPGKSVVDCVWMSRLLGYEAVAHGDKLLKCFVDLTKAYDRVDRPTLWEILRRYGVPDELVNLIAGLHDGSMATIQVGGCTTEVPFELKRGLKQGSVFAPLLFNIFFGCIMNCCRKKFKEQKLAGC